MHQDYFSIFEKIPILERSISSFLSSSFCIFSLISQIAFLFPHFSLLTQFLSPSFGSWYRAGALLYFIIALIGSVFTFLTEGARCALSMIYSDAEIEAESLCCRQNAHSFNSDGWAFMLPSFLMPEDFVIHKCTASYHNWWNKSQYQLRDYNIIE